MLTRSLRLRMTLLFAASTTGLMLLVGAGILAYSAHAAGRAADRVLGIAARRVQSELVEEGGVRSPSELVRDEIEILERTDGAMLILDHQGRVLAQSQRNVPRWPRQEDDGWRVAAVRADRFTIVIGLPWWKTRAALRNQALMVAAMILCITLITVLGAWVLVGRTLSPIRALARQADAASSGVLGVRLEAPSHDAELVELVGTLNRLLEHLAQTAAARGRFYAAASHELRTPLQALCGHLELALTRPRTTEEYRSVLDEAYGQTRRLTRLVQELLLLNQLHQRTSRPPAEPVELGGTLERILYQLRGGMNQNRLRVELEVPEEAFTRAPTAHAEILLRNLVENAAKYADPGTTVSLRVAPEPDGWLFEIENRCSGHLRLREEQVFEPFFRPDASRSSRTGGNGLGLAICKAVAETNSWHLAWRHDGDAVVARVWFPGPLDLSLCSEAGAEDSLSCREPAAVSH